MLKISQVNAEKRNSISPTNHVLLCIKQLLDEVEHDIMNYQNQGVLSAEAEGSG